MNIIEAHDLSYRYAGAGAAAVCGLSVAVAAGEVFGFLGPSGAGKSTTQKILTGLLRDYSGTARVFGRDLAVWRPSDYANIGVSFELPNHFLKLTARENLRYFAALYRQPTRSPAEVLDLVGLSEAIDLQVGSFSKGMRVRLNLARALLHQPELLFLDEPTSGLDPVNARRIKDVIKAEQGAGRTIFLTTHNMALADELCDRVAFITGGQIAATDAPKALRLRYGTPTVKVEYREGQGVAAQLFPLPGLSTNAQFMALLRTDSIQTMHSQEATLEEVFVRVTGGVWSGE
jgi:fluoroquinolone transport system ATP-binding protein